MFRTRLTPRAEMRSHLFPTFALDLNNNTFRNK
uniref:Uncharacterized protein n=1 Tax=Anguilla anguilla TaxID=7936 RepID=A0A0E9PLU3_ANGAN